MTWIADLSAAWRRVHAFPAVRIEDAESLARDFGLKIVGPDGDGVVWAELRDPETGAAYGKRLGTADEATAWLAWRERRELH